MAGDEKHPIASPGVPIHYFAGKHNTRRGSMNHTPQYVLKKINDHIVEHSGFETHREYLSVSHISECPRKVAREFRDGFSVESHTHHMCYAGYEHEQNMLKMLGDLEMLEQTGVEVVSPFDERLRGHMDAVWDGNVIEIKSVSRNVFDKVAKKTDKALWKHFVQVQLYMRYSGLRRALIIYRCRETYQHMVIAVPYIEHQAVKFEEKAEFILRKLDAGELPDCECGMCKE